MQVPEKIIWTIGHSTHSIETLITMLKASTIECVVDIRRYPGSRRYPHFNKDALAERLSQNHINYIHEVDLGGRRSAKKDSKNTGWRVAAFKGYADYMETATFKDAVERLEDVSSKFKTAYMCSEAVWWSCHRSLISDYLKVKGWKVMHIMAEEKIQEHPFTSPAKIVDGQLTYH